MFETDRILSVDLLIHNPSSSELIEVITMAAGHSTRSNSIWR